MLAVWLGLGFLGVSGPSVTSFNSPLKFLAGYFDFILWVTTVLMRCRLIDLIGVKTMHL